MDASTATVLSGVIGFLGGGVLASWVTWKVSERRSADADKDRALERERFAWEQAQPDLAKAEEAYEAVRDLSHDMTRVGDLLSETTCLEDFLEVRPMVIDVLRRSDHVRGRVYQYGHPRVALMLGLAIQSLRQYFNALQSQSEDADFDAMFQRFWHQKESLRKAVRWAREKRSIGKWPDD